MQGENITSAEFYELLAAYRKQHPTLRKGQAAFNLMDSLRCDDVDRLRGTLLDPFYNDEIVDEFVNAIL